MTGESVSAEAALEDGWYMLTNTRISEGGPYIHRVKNVRIAGIATARMLMDSGWEFTRVIVLTADEHLRLVNWSNATHATPPAGGVERAIIEAMRDDWLSRFEPGTQEWADAQVIAAWLDGYRGTMYDGGSVG